MKLFTFLKGIAIGISNVVAGLSGGTIAVITKVYDDIIDICANIFAHPIKTIKKHLMLILGLIVGIIGGAFLLKNLYEHFPFAVSMFFCGIVVVGFISLLKSDFKNNKVSDYILLIIGALIIIAIPLITGSSPRELNLSFKGIVILFILGIFSAGSMILPGISGSMVLASFGYYDAVLSLVTNFFGYLKDKNFDDFSKNLLLIIIFAAGCLAGIFLISLLIRYLFSMYKRKSNDILIGLVGGSVIAMVLVVLLNKENRYLFKTTRGYVEIGFGFLLLFAGLFLGVVLNRLGKKDKHMFDTQFFIDEAKKYKDEWIDTTTKLVKFESVLDEFDPNSKYPFGKENAYALDFMLNQAKADGFNVLNQDNYAGHIEFGEGKETLGILAHLDVVPVKGQNWDQDPFTATLKDNGTKLVGRGVNDDKGPLVASYLALKMLKKLGFEPKKRILLIMGCDEESGSRCLEHYFKKNPMPEFGFSPDACFPCINGEKAHVCYNLVGNLKDSPIISFKAGERYNIVPGFAQMTLNVDLSKEFNEYLSKNNLKGKTDGKNYSVEGLSAHAMTPEKGINAAFLLFEFLNEYSNCKLSSYVCKYLSNDPFGKKLHMEVSHEEMGVLTENVGVVDIENGKVLIGVDCRVPVNNYDSVMEQKIQESLKEYDCLNVEFISRGDTHYVASDSTLVKALMDAYSSVTKDYDNKAYCIGGGTYAKFIENAVAFGPQFIGREDVDHQANEYVYVDDFVKCIAIYAKAIYELVK